LGGEHQDGGEHHCGNASRAAREAP
jgi:hypothetical protein